MSRKIPLLAFAAAALAMTATAQNNDNNWRRSEIRHVLLISIDGMHAVDYLNCTKGVAGVNDGSLGALLPYALRGYHISTGSVAILYGAAFAGWVVAALIGGYVRVHIGSGGVLVLGASSQLVAFALRVWVSLATANWLEKLLLAETLTCVRCTGTTVRRLLCHILARGLGSGFPRLAGEYVRFDCQHRAPLVGRRACELWFWMSCWSSDCYCDSIREAREVDMVLLALAWTRRS